jgi:toxin YoeB
MEVVFLPKADEDFEYWQQSGNKAVLKKIAQLTEAIVKNPYNGIGKPEALKYRLIGKWSLRITNEHRYIYQIDNNLLKVYSLKGHY